MAHKGTSVWIRDGSGGGRLQAFYAHSRWRYGEIRCGEYGKGAVQTLSFLPKRIRGRRYRPLRAGFVTRFWLTYGLSHRGQGAALYVKPWNVGCALLKKRGTLRSKYTFGPIIRPRATKQFFGRYRIVV